VNLYKLAELKERKGRLVNQPHPQSGLSPMKTLSRTELGRQKRLLGKMTRHRARIWIPMLTMSMTSQSLIRHLRLLK
jgi:hypothetical protein